MRKQLVPFLVVVLGVLAAAARVEGHAFLVRAEPRVGSKVNKAPTEVRVWFSETVQAGVSSIKVFDVSGKQVDKKDTHSDRANPAVLCVSVLPALIPGAYKVVWRVTSADTHVTNGDFRFQVLGTQRAAVSSQAR
jgi:methionine-rich copper-binding protein CopC